jgi:hypothetical protein
MGADHGLTLAFRLAFHYLRSPFYRVTAAADQARTHLKNATWIFWKISRSRRQLFHVIIDFGRSDAAPDFFAHL